MEAERAKLDLVGRTALANATPSQLLYDALNRPIGQLPTVYDRQNDPAYSGRSPGPGVPILPWLPRSDDPRQWFTAQGYNLNYIPRSEFKSLTPFQTLRTLADTSDIVALAIEDVTQQVVGLDCDVHPTKVEGLSADDEKDRSKLLAPNRARVLEFLKYPDREHSFKRWLTMIMENLLVIDAVSLYRQRTEKGDPYALVVVDGATVKPIVDFYGRAPEAPHTAYQQIGYGRVETEFHRPYARQDDLRRAIEAGRFDPTQRPVELVYAPKKPRSFTPYGQSPVERVLITVNLALRRQLHYLAYYTDGNIPEAFWKCPQNWEPHQVEHMQDAFEKLLDGESGRRRRLRFMPGGEGAGLENARGDDEWKKEFDEYLARVVCMAFSTSPLPLVQLMNRATGEMADAEESHSGHHPLMGYVKEVLTREIQEFLGEPDLEFIWTEDKERDERLFLDQASGFVAKGVWNRNEVRAEQGKDPIPGGEVYTVDTPSGPVPLEEFLLAGGGIPAIGGPPRPGGNPLDLPLPPAAGGGSAMGGDEKAKAPGEASSGEAAAALDVPLPPAAEKIRARMIAEDLRRWRKVALKSVRTGVGRQFNSSKIPPPLAAALHEWLSYSSTREDVDWAFRSLAKAKRPLVAARRRMRLERKMRISTREYFAAVKGPVARLVASAYTPKATKMEWLKGMSAVDVERLSKADEGPTDEQIDSAMDWEAFLDAVRPTLTESYLEGETLASDVSGQEVTYGLTDEQAAAYANERGAELVGKRVLPDGTVVDNPNSKWAVSSSVRDRLRETVAKAFDEGWSQKQLQEEIESPTFWSWRSDMIARTEVAVALNKGTVQVYRDAEVETVTLVDGRGCLLDGHDDDVAGVNGTVVTVEEFEEYPVGHPNCRRDAIPNLPKVE